MTRLIIRCFISPARHFPWMNGITDYDGMPNIFSYNLENGGFKILSDNTDGVLKSYVYFDGNENAGLGKASVTFDPVGRNIYFIQGDEIRKISGGRITVLSRILYVVLSIQW